MRRTLLAAEAWATLAFASFLCAALPFRRVAALAGRKGASRAARPAQAARIAWAIDAAARRSFWRPVCLQQGLAAQLMLRRRGLAATLHYGAALEQSAQLVAHVWVRSGEVDVVGCDGLERYGVLATFPAP